MRILSVNVGQPRWVGWQGEQVQTSIWKAPVGGAVRVGRTNLEGDQQSDLSVHGGLDKAVYAYPSEHYPAWRDDLDGTPLDAAAFGENLTTEGLLEDDVHPGDRFRIGSVELEVSQPRMPCFKLGIRLGRLDVGRRMLQAGRTGFYLRVLNEGTLSAGDAIVRLDRAASSMPIRELALLYAGESAAPDRLRLAADIPALPEGWRQRFRRKLAETGGDTER